MEGAKSNSLALAIDWPNFLDFSLTTATAEVYQIKIKAFTEAAASYVYPGAKLFETVTPHASWISLPDRAFENDEFSVSFIDPVASRRLALLESFTGDEEAGFEKPKQVAINDVKAVLSSLCTVTGGIKSPAVTPAPDGDVLLTWKFDDSYLRLEFSDDGEVAWAFKQTKPISGMINISNALVLKELELVLHSMQNPQDHYYVSGSSTGIEPPGTSTRQTSHAQVFLSRV